MTQQYSYQLTPSISTYDDVKGNTKQMDIELLEVSPETNCIVSKYPGESGAVYAQTRVVQPSRYRVTIAIPASTSLILDDCVKNLLNASHTPMSKFAVTSYYTKCWDMVVLSSHMKDTPDVQGLRIQEIVLEECLYPPKTPGYALSSVSAPEDSSTASQTSQAVTA